MNRFLCISTFFVLMTALACGDDKASRPSPPATAQATLTNGATVTINYSQPSVKGRKIGSELAPYGQVWRTGANEATIFEVSKDVTVEGKPLPAGSYSLFTVPGESEWTLIFNKQTGQWGTDYKESEDLFRVPVKAGKAPVFTEKMTFSITEGGKVSLWWGDTAVDFMVN